MADDLRVAERRTLGLIQSAQATDTYRAGGSTQGHRLFGVSHKTPVGSTTVTYDGQTAELSSAPYLLAGETMMVPVDFFEKALGVPTRVDAAGGVILFERDDAVGRISFGK